MFNLFNSGGSTYSVLLERPNGFNKEVVIDDCFDENEAIEKAHNSNNKSQKLSSTNSPKLPPHYAKKYGQG